MAAGQGVEVGVGAVGADRAGFDVEGDSSSKCLARRVLRFTHAAHFGRSASRATFAVAPTSRDAIPIPLPTAATGAAAATGAVRVRRTTGGLRVSSTRDGRAEAGPAGGGLDDRAGSAGHIVRVV